MAAATAAFFRKIPVVHVEAGLRTGDLTAPWPEEFNRRVAGIVTRRHCAPTAGAADALRREGVPDDHIRITGNTVIDALLYTVQQQRADDARLREKYPAAASDSVVLVTGHRRENFGQGLANVCDAIARLAEKHPPNSFHLSGSPEPERPRPRPRSARCVCQCPSDPTGRIP